MKIDSFSNSIITPVKSQDKLRGERFSLTPEQKSMLTSMENVHQFLHHGDISFASLEGMNLTTDSIIDIHAFFDEMDPDIPDIMLKQEESAISKKEFTEKINLI